MWQKACGLLNNLISTHNLYIFVQQNRHQVLSRLKKFFELNDISLQIDEFVFPDCENKKDEVKDYNIDNENDLDYEIKELPNPAAYKPLNFQITLCSSEWGKIKPIYKVYTDGRIITFLKRTG